MSEELEQKIDEQALKLDAIYKSVEKTRKYFLIIIWVSVIAFVLPLLGMLFVIPAFLNNYLGSFEGLL